MTITLAMGHRIATLLWLCLKAQVLLFSINNRCVTLRMKLVTRHYAYRSPSLLWAMPSTERFRYHRHHLGKKYLWIPFSNLLWRVHKPQGISIPSTATFRHLAYLLYGLYIVHYYWKIHGLRSAFCIWRDHDSCSSTFQPFKIQLTRLTLSFITCPKWWHEIWKRVLNYFTHKFIHEALFLTLALFRHCPFNGLTMKNY